MQHEVTEWPQRPWILAIIAAIGGAIFGYLIDHGYADPMTVTEQVAATFVAVAFLSLIVTLDRRRPLWAVAFALVAGAVIAFVGYFTATYNRGGSLFEFPYLSAIFAALVAAPFVQAARDKGALNLDYPTLHRYAWSDAVIGAASMAFTGLTFILVVLMSQLFKAIGIELLDDALQEPVFNGALAGIAFGGAWGLLRESDKLLDTLLRLVTMILAVLAPVLAVGLGIFLLALPITGLASLWESGLPETPLMLAIAAWSALLLNSVIGTSSEERHPRRFFRWSAMALGVMVLPLALISSVSLGMRIDQYGWTPDRIWGVICAGAATVYGVASVWAVIKAREDFDRPLRDSQVKIGLGLIGLSLFLALPILDFGAISAKSQVDRLEAGKVELEEFDFAAMAFDFGPNGRKSLQHMVESDGGERATFAQAALKADNRWHVQSVQRGIASAASLQERLVLRPETIELTEELRSAIGFNRLCEERQCLLVEVEDGLFALIGSWSDDEPVVRSIIDNSRQVHIEEGRRTNEEAIILPPTPSKDGPAPGEIDFESVDVEVREETVRRLYVDGKPVGQAFR